MKSPIVILIAAVCCLLAACSGMLPTDTTVQAIDIATTLDTPQIVPSETIGWLAVEPIVYPSQPQESADTELDTSVAPEKPVPTAENPDTSTAKSCPAKNANSASRSSNSHARHARGGDRDFILFDGDGYLFDRRADAAAARGCSRGDGGWYPGKGIVQVGKAVLGVNRRQNRRAAGGGVFGCRCS